MILKNLEFLVGKSLPSKKGFEPFDDTVCEFLDFFSKDLFNISKKLDRPDLASLAFWCRKNNLIKLKEKHNQEKIAKGLGLVFHITPSNIPTNFAYSLVFGILTGNNSVIKVPTKKFEEIKIICERINYILKIKKFRSIKNKITIIRYTDKDNITKQISQISDGRLIWGGDNTVKEIKSFRAKTRSIDLTFGDRYSFAVINSESLKKLNENQMMNLIKNFYNDTYLVDQNACSSPHLIIWLGKANKIKNIFWQKLLEYVKENYDHPSIASIDKLSDLYNSIILNKEIKKIKTFDKFLYVITLKKLHKNLDNNRGRWGFFYQIELENFIEIKNFMTDKFQTMTYFGLDKEKLKKFIQNNQINGLNRIVPIGQALNINFYWDGYDILNILTKKIDLR
jgi:hypothetical protein